MTATSAADREQYLWNGTPMRGLCGHCQIHVDSTDPNHRVTSIFAGGRGVECVLRGDIAASDGGPLRATSTDVDKHRFELAMPYPWGGCRFVCSCGESGQVVPDEGAARAEHQRHAPLPPADGRGRDEGAAGMKDGDTIDFAAIVPKRFDDPPILITVEQRVSFSGPHPISARIDVERVSPTTGRKLKPEHVMTLTLDPAKGGVGELLRQVAKLFDLGAVTIGASYSDPDTEGADA